ncbi:MAG: hypothetical protein HY370_04170 [Proteobacteria bacterium]|nr:hypothetical protein [Pseudomonadota bacterium]
MSEAGTIAVDAVFAAFGIDALYVPQSGPSVSVRVVSKSRDETIAFDMTRISVSTRVFEMRRSEPVTPAAGDSLTVGDDTYVIQGEPLSVDVDRLVWTLDTRPA